MAVRILGYSIESRLERLKEKDPFACKRAAERLVRYYRKKGKNEDCTHVIKILGNSYENAANNTAPLRALALLKCIHKIYIDNNLKDDAERVNRKIREIGPKCVGRYEADIL